MVQVGGEAKVSCCKILQMNKMSTFGALLGNRANLNPIWTTPSGESAPLSLPAV